MQRQKLRDRWKFALAFACFVLSNASAWVFVAWLIPGVVYLEAAAWLLLGALCLGLAARSNLLPDLAEGMRRNWELLPFLGFAAISIFWSVDGQISIARWIVLLAAIVTGGYFGLQFPMKQIVWALAILTVFILIISAGLVVLVPRIGVMNYYNIQGAWKGIYWHKNHMGIIAVLANVLVLLNLIEAFRSRTKSKWCWGVLYVLSLAFVTQTDSVGSYLTLIAVHLVILLAAAHSHVRDRLRRGHYLIFLLAAALLIVAVFANSERIFGAFNRKANLTGRVPMWGHLFDTYLSQRPIGGYGFNAFWYIDSHRVGMQQLAGYPDEIVIADNGFIDILMCTGYVGLALFLLFYVGLWVRSIVYAWHARDVFGLFPLTLMAYSLVANVSWSLLFENESFMMLTMLTVMFSMSRRAQVDGVLEAAKRGD